MKCYKQKASSSCLLVFSDEKRPVEHITGNFNVVWILWEFHTPGLLRKKPSLTFYVWFKGFFTIRKDMKHYSIANHVFLASHSRSLCAFITHQFPLYNKGKNTAEVLEVLMDFQNRLTQYLWDFLRKEYTSPSHFWQIRICFATLYTTVVFTIDLSILKSMCWNPIMYAI